MNVLTLELRTLARRMGLIRLINKLRPTRPYEEHFHKALRLAIRPGDVVWDVGANVGLYTEIFSNWTGPEGRVIAFEPLVDCCTQIQQRVRDQSWVTVRNLALGDEDRLGFLLTTDDHVSNRIENATSTHSEHNNKQPVLIAQGDTVAREMQQLPNVVKIDVEGFEEEVLRGMWETLKSPTLYTVLIEVHFAVLEASGKAKAPLRIERMLRDHAYRTTWVDASHLIATRVR
jgi:FkbM family methyltransferase